MHAIKLLVPLCFMLGGVVLWAVPGLSADESSPTERAKKFVAAHEAKLRPLEVAASLAWWNANTTGKDEDFARKEATQNKIDEALADPAAFADLSQIFANVFLSFFHFSVRKSRRSACPTIYWSIQINPS